MKGKNLVDDVEVKDYSSLIGKFYYRNIPINSEIKIIAYITCNENIYLHMKGSILLKGTGENEQFLESFYIKEEKFTEEKSKLISEHIKQITESKCNYSTIHTSLKDNTKTTFEEKIEKINSDLFDALANENIKAIDNEFPVTEHSMKWQEFTFDKMEGYYSEIKIFLRELEMELGRNHPQYFKIQSVLEHFRNNNDARDSQIKNV